MGARSSRQTRIFPFFQFSFDNDALHRLAGVEEVELPLTEKYDPTDTSMHTQCDACGERYCSEMCMSKAAVYHEALCCRTCDPEERRLHPVGQVEEAWKKMHTPPETASITILLKLMAMLQHELEISDQASNEGHSEASDGLQLFRDAIQMEENEEDSENRRFY